MIERARLQKMNTSKPRKAKNEEREKEIMENP